jgi:2-polyprenyl-3-methyl-5-hydroxy-6-metoxy-1,4-benzoquinol methylase
VKALTASDLNRGISDERFQYRRCYSCATYFLTPVPAELSRYYPSDYFTPLSAQTIDRLAQVERYRVEMLLEHISPGALVEIGPGEGLFARAAHNAGFKVTGIEMDASACERLRTIVEIDAINSDVPEEVLPTLPPSRAIAMWHVAEHLQRPWEVIEGAAANLEPGGVLVIAMPNPRALQFRLLRQRFAHLDAPRHLFLIPAKTLARRCQELGLQQVSTTTADPSGRHWNQFGWEYALRRSPRDRHATIASRVLSLLITLVLRPIETHAENGCTYTSVFLKGPAT